LSEKAKEQVKVTDRRLFTKDGVRRETSPDERRSGHSAPPPPTAAAEPSSEADAAAQTPFTNFILQFAEMGFLSLGQVPMPDGSQPQVDLQAAGNMIDILRMLQEKTRGNLNPSEKQVMDNLIYQLQVGYLKKRGEPETPEGQP